MSTNSGNVRPAGNGIVVEKDVLIPMRDGVHLAVDVYRPDAPGTYPTLYAASPYRKDLAYLPAIPTFTFRETGNIERWVRRGYVYVHADVRGSGKSIEGQWRVMDAHEQQDHYDTIEWIAKQPWSNEKVGMIGESYYGWTQWMAAAQQPPHLACIAPYDGLVDLYRDAVYHGGLADQGFVNTWFWGVRARVFLDQPTPPPSDTMSYDFIHELLQHATDGPYWWERSAYPKFDQIQTPFYSIGNWNTLGLHLRGNLLAFEQINAPKKLLVNADLPNIKGSAAVQQLFETPEIEEELQRWYDYWLKGIDTGIMNEPPVKLFIRNGEGYRVEQEWPLQRTQYTPLYLRQGPSKAVTSLNDGRLSWSPPTAEEPATTYSYPDREWRLGPTVIGKRGLPHQTKKLLTYTSDPLEKDMEVTGPIVVKLWASSNQQGADFYVKIADQAPLNVVTKLLFEKVLDIAPPASMVSRGWLKASHRAIDPERSTAHRPFHTHQEPQPLEPGKIYLFEIEVWPTSWVFKKGHRIRVELANADSPIADGAYNHYYGVKMGTDTIFHDAEHPSHLILPLIPGTA